MLDYFKFHHIGYVTDNIINTSSVYMQAGYQASSIFEDGIQRVRICFLTKSGCPMIELVEPADEHSSVNKILKKNGVSPYHICYEVDDINVAFNKLTEELNYIPLFRPVEAVAMGDKQICYLYKETVGFIELVNK
jgi:methylmalonyl-CoA/ethylmalonyl-CoA epimerase